MAEQGTAQVAEEKKEIQGSADPEKAKHEAAQKAEEAKKDEETKKHEEQHGPPEGSKRWNEIYFKAKEYERQQETVKDLTSAMTELKKHNAELAKVLSPETAKPQKTPEGLLKELRDAKKAALKEYDYDKAFEVQEKIDDVILYISSTHKEEARKDAKKVVAEDDIEKAAMEFAANNNWFSRNLPDGSKNPNYSVVKAGAAIEIEKELMQGWKGSYRDLLKEVKKELVKHFPEDGNGKEKEGEDEVKAPIVGSAIGSKGSASSKIVLSADQKRVIANMFGDDPEGEKKYIAQLAIIQAGRAK